MTQGHEFTGTIHEVGSNVKNFKVGDKVVSPFTVCCMNVPLQSPYVSGEGVTDDPVFLL